MFSDTCFISQKQWKNVLDTSRYPLDENLLASRIAQSNFGAMHHGITCCLLQISRVCAEEPSLTEPGDVREQQMAVSKRVQGIIMQEYVHYLPVFRLAGMARSYPHLSPDMYHDGQPGGYSISVYAVLKKLCIMQHQSSSDWQAAALMPNAMNVRAMLSPMQIDARMHTVVWLSTSSSSRSLGDGKELNASDAFASGDCSRAGFSLQKEDIQLPATEPPQTRQLINLKDMWLSFGEGVPGDQFHSIPTGKSDILRCNQLPPYRLALVKDLLVRTGGNFAAPSMVGWYVLYSGKGQIVRTSSNSGSRPQLQGIVLAEHKTSDRKKVMCEVLYTNGWVIWHNKASFTEKTSSRTARLLAFRTLPEMLGNTAEYILSNTNPDAPQEDPVEHWIRSMEEFQQILNTGERRQSADSVRARLKALVQGMKEVYNGFA